MLNDILIRQFSFYYMIELNIVLMYMKKCKEKLTTDYIDVAFLYNWIVIIY